MPRARCWLAWRWSWALAPCWWRCAGDGRPGSRRKRPAAVMALSLAAAVLCEWTWRHWMPEVSQTVALRTECNSSTWMSTRASRWMRTWKRLGHGLAIAGVVRSACSLASGCNLMATAMYIIDGQNTKADFNGLKGKRVAVVCRPVTSLHFRDSSVSRDLAKQVGLLLEERVQDQARRSARSL